MRCFNLEKTAVLYVDEEDAARNQTVRLWCELTCFFGGTRERRSQVVALSMLTSVITTTVSMLRGQGYDVRVRALVTKDLAAL